MRVPSLDLHNYLQTRTTDLRVSQVDVTRQIASAKKSKTAGGLGLDAQFALGLRRQVSTLDAYERVSTNALQRLKTVSMSLQAISNNLRSDDGLSEGLLDRMRAGNGEVDRLNGLNRQAENDLNVYTGRLNSNHSGVFLFGGQKTDTPPVAYANEILEGTDTQIGLREAIRRRELADGISGLGRLTLTDIPDLVPGATANAVPAETATSFTLSDIQGRNSDRPIPQNFGFQITAIGGGMANNGVARLTEADPQNGINAAIRIDTDPPGPLNYLNGVSQHPSTISVGQTLRITLRLPDGTDKIIQLTARAAGVPAQGEDTFEVSASDHIANARNLHKALNDAFTREAGRSLKAASNHQASVDMFAFPSRVVADPQIYPDPELIDHHDARFDLVSWYRGERASEVEGPFAARPWNSGEVTYGVRADQPDIASVLRMTSLMAAVQTPPEQDLRGESHPYYLLLAKQNDGAGESAPIAESQTNFHQLEGRIGLQQQLLQEAKDRAKTLKDLSQTQLNDVEGADMAKVSSLATQLDVDIKILNQLTVRLLQNSLVNLL